MHEDQVDVPTDTVARLVAAQFPRWRDLPVRPVVSPGTVNALFLLGDEIVLRFPLQPAAGPAMASAVRDGQDNARRVAAVTDLDVPEPLGLGRPGEGYPGLWTVYRWIPGETVSAENLDEADLFARDLARFVRDLRSLDTGGRTWDGQSRGGPLSGLATEVGEALAASTRLVDVPRLTEVWQRCLAAPDHPGPDVWIHADLMPGNLLVREGRLAAVIDLGATAVGDPAVDLIPAWNLLPAGPSQPPGPSPLSAPSPLSGPRQTYRDELDVDDAAWERGRGWALAQAVIALPYYRHTNPVMASTARRTLAAVLE